MIIRVSVSQDDIKRGSRCAMYTCPVAIALSRNFPDVGVSVHSDQVWINGKRIAYLPNWVAKRIDNYDNGRVMNPFEFELNYDY